MKHKYLFTFLVLSVISRASLSIELEKCLGPVCVNQESGSFKKIRSLYAAKANIKSLPKGEALRAACSPVSQQLSAIFLYEGDTAPIEASHLGMMGLTKLNVCHQDDIKKLPALALTHSLLGRLIGANKVEVRKKFGKPNIVVNTVRREAEDIRNAITFGGKKYGQECWIYSDENDPETLLANTICFDQEKKVMTIWISEMP